MAMKRIFGVPLVPLILAVAAVGVLLTLLVTRSGSREQEASAPVDQGIQGKGDAAKTKTVKGQKRHPRPGDRYVVVDTHANRVYLRTQDKILMEAVCSTGSGDTLQDSVSGRLWVFNTPRGEFEVTSKLVEPWWRKPDWAFIADGEKPPPPSQEQERLDPEMMGDYAIGFGDGYFIHGTLYERLLGVNVTHGCVRLGAADLKVLYSQVSIGTTVYVF
jgi:lipoprotein-anchoring transpeptidase ErfK/SrfK